MTKDELWEKDILDLEEAVKLLLEVYKYQYGSNIHEKIGEFLKRMAVAY